MVSDAEYAAQQVVLLPPYRTLAEGLTQALVQVVLRFWTVPNARDGGA